MRLGLKAGDSVDKVDFDAIAAIEKTYTVEPRGDTTILSSINGERGTLNYV